jgi:hypothetical protein
LKLGRLPIQAVSNRNYRKRYACYIVPKLAMIRLRQKYSGDGYEDQRIYFMLRKTIRHYGIGGRSLDRVISMSRTKRQDAALQITQQLVPDFAPDNPYKTKLLCCAIGDLYDNKHVLRWLLSSITGTLYVNRIPARLASMKPFAVCCSMEIGIP